MNPEREKMVRSYIEGYNHFDVDKMVADFHEAITFENIQNGEVNLTISGILAFKQQAELAKSYFSTRQQTIHSFVHRDDETEIEISYAAVLAMDLPNGMKTGETLNLIGKSIFKFSNGKVIKLSDIS